MGWAGLGAGLRCAARVTLYQGPDLVKVTLAVVGAGRQQTTLPHSGTKHYYIPTVHCPLSSVCCYN